MKQFDQPFLILSSAGEFAKVINRVTKLESVDTWVSEFKRRINKTNNEVELLESQIQESETELKKYEGFEWLDTEILNLKLTSENLEQSEKDLLRLDGLLDRIESIDDELKRLSPALDIEKDIIDLTSLDSLLISIQNRLILIDKAKGINNYIQKLQLIEDDLQMLILISEQEEKFNKLDKTLARIEKIDDAVKNCSSILIDIDNLISLKEQEERYKYLQEKINTILIINNYTASIKIIYNKYNSELKELLKNTTECPIFLKACPSVKEMMK